MNGTTTLADLNVSGYVGIGTTTPQSSLQIQASVGITPFKVSSSTGIGLLTLDTAGNLTIKGSLTQNGSPDVAENVIAADPSIEAGDVVMIDSSYVASSTADIYNHFAVTKATSTGEVLGVISTDPGVLINAGPSVPGDSVLRPLVLAGRVPVKVTDENGVVRIGDYLAPSKQFPGYAMKATNAGFVLGRALENFADATTSLVSLPAIGANPVNGSKVLTFIQISYWQPTVADLLQSAQPSDSSLLVALDAINMTDASVFGNLVVKDSLFVQKDLHVQGVIYAAELDVDTIVAKKLCLDDVCVTKDQLKALLQMVGQQTSAPSGQSQPAQPASQPDQGQVAPQPDSGLVAGTTTPPSVPGQDASGLSPAPDSLPADPVPPAPPVEPTPSITISQ